VASHPAADPLVPQIVFVRAHETMKARLARGPPVSDVLATMTQPASSSHVAPCKPIRTNWMPCYRRASCGAAISSLFPVQAAMTLAPNATSCLPAAGSDNPLPPRENWLPRIPGSRQTKIKYLKWYCTASGEDRCQGWSGSGGQHRAATGQACASSRSPPPVVGILSFVKGYRIQIS